MSTLRQDVVASARRRSPLLWLACALCLALALASCSDNTAEQSDVGTDVADAGDTSTSTDAKDTNSGDVCDASNDCDNDGLDDCEEQELGTDACDADTDGDGLSDESEVAIGTDPLDPDSDDDGLEDGAERDFGFDPLDPDSKDDGVLDGDRWIVGACDELQPRSTQRVGSQDGGWAIALNDDWSATQVEVPGNENITGAWASANAQPVAVGLATLDLEGADTSPLDVEPQLLGAVESLGTIDRTSIGGEFQTHWFAKALYGSFDVVTDQPTNITEVRNRLYEALSGHAAADFEPALPTDSAQATSRFAVSVTTVMYSTPSGQLRPVRVWAVAPENEAAWGDSSGMLMDDITNTTALAPYGQTREEACWRYRSPTVQGRDALVLVDTSSATIAQRDAIASTLSSMLEYSGNYVDLRLAVAPLDPANAVPSRWHRDRDALIADLDALFADPPAASRGIEAVRAAVTAMHDGSGAIQFDPDAWPVVILLSAAEDAGMAELSESERQAEIEATRQVLEGENVYLQGALGGLYSSCPGQASDAYKELLSTYMANPYDLCEENGSYYGELLGFTSPYAFPDTPISGSMRLFTDGVELPRSRQAEARGWFYLAQTNSVNHSYEQPPLRGEQETFVVEAQVWAEPNDE